MKIEVNDDAVYELVHQVLMQMEEDMPQSKKLTKAIKRINHNIMIPTDWEEMYDQDFVEYDTGEYK
tara:strand:+ start:12662 stop:12859 length:198 start_codon:yes stop_codon:yes gene_type:complete